jgi:hypothetical protein
MTLEAERPTVVRFRFSDFAEKRCRKSSLKEHFRARIVTRGPVADCLDWSERGSSEGAVLTFGPFEGLTNQAPGSAGGGMISGSSS